MGQQQQVVRDCDRCATQKRAVETVRMGYDGNFYEIDVCQQHADMLDREMRSWTRLAREVEPPKSSLGLTEAERAFLHRTGPQIKRPTGPVKIVLEEPVEPLEDLVEVYPTETALRALEEIQLDWPAVVAGVRHPETVAPTDRVEVSQYYSRGLEILVSADHHVLGVRRREDGTPQETLATSPTKKIVRKGKRGGIGNVGPRTHEDLLEAIRRSPGWRLEQGGKHYKVLGPEGQVSTLPVTPSDWRGTLNAVAELRALGLDLRAQARQSA
jgi:hypothetical protein